MRIALRRLESAAGPNDGTRSLAGSLLVPELVKAITDWTDNAPPNRCVLIGGAAFSYYAKPRTTTDLDLLVLNDVSIPDAVTGFKRVRPHAFEHRQTGVEIEVLSPETISVPIIVVRRAFDTAREVDGIRIASPTGIVALKLGRFKSRDQADIIELINLGLVDDAELKTYKLNRLATMRYKRSVTNAKAEKE